MNNFDILCSAIDKSLDEITREIEAKGLNDTSLNNLHKLTDTKKNILKIEKLEMGYGDDAMPYENGNSNRVPMYYNTNSYRNGGGRSYRNSYYQNTGNQYGGNGYSMTGQDGSSYHHLEEAMRHATSEEERNAIRQLMSSLYK